MADQSGVTLPIVAIGAALASAITVLFRLLMKQNEKQVDMSSRLGRLEGEHEGIRNLSAKTLETVHKAIVEAPGCEAAQQAGESDDSSGPSKKR